MATTLLLARHGETDWNRENRFQGHADPPLNDAGREQARSLAAELAADPPTAVYASPLRRALETANIVAAHLDLPVRAREELREVDVGEWSGLTRAEVEARHPADFRRWLAVGQGWQRGETYEQCSRRVLPAVLEIAAAHPDERVLAITHGGPIRAVRAAAAGTTYEDLRRSGFALGNCAVAVFAVEDGRVRPVD